ncbi:RibD family protein [Kineosporia sp. J2-2]|uniref:RibD family protein n=1 Tax=Kineosporia corallincola TaxID=2835133 RepID=A0ABS5TMS7_9ACTN|nr:RibD family protein [Kineosporia corallincola]MBT0772148.1 RibD family protein [Kineosporia corallincola]
MTTLLGDAVGELVGRDEWAAVNALGRPFVVYKFAATLDGRIAAADGTSQWITSAASRAEVHLLRAGCDATVIGSGTQRADDPNLAVRGDDDPRLDLSAVAAKGQPYRVVVDTDARTPSGARVLDGSAPTVIAVAPDARADHLSAAEVIRIPRSDHGLSVPVLLESLYAKGVRGVFLEGGPTLAGSFIAARLVDRVINYVAPALLGAGKSGLLDAGIGTMADILRLELLDIARSGPDLRLVARPAL